MVRAAKSRKRATSKANKRSPSNSPEVAADEEMQMISRLISEQGEKKKKAKEQNAGKRFVASAIKVELGCGIEFEEFRG